LFIQAFRKEFGRIWKADQENKKMYHQAIHVPYENVDIRRMTLHQFVLFRMQNAYKDILKRYYPQDPLFGIEEKIQKGYTHSGETLHAQAEREVYNYLENETCVGCCGLLCLFK
jgi:hypothetical protein